MAEFQLIYVKVVTPSEPENQLNVSTNVVAEFININGGERHAILDFLDKDGEQWELKFCTRMEKVHLKPYISRATWKTFSTAKRICAGDILLFYKRIHQHGEEFFIRVLREEPLMVMGAQIGTHWVDI